MLNKIINLLGGYTIEEVRSIFGGHRTLELVTMEQSIRHLDEKLLNIEKLLNYQLEEIKYILKANTFQNRFDFTKKKRGWKGLWKLTEAQIEEIKSSIGTQEALAKKYGVSRARIGVIKRTGK